jgi:hypothetical protein
MGVDDGMAEGIGGGTEGEGVFSFINSIGSERWKASRCEAI